VVHPFYRSDCNYEYTLCYPFSLNRSTSCPTRSSPSSTVPKLFPIHGPSSSRKPCPGSRTVRSKLGLGQTRQPDYRAREAKCEGGSRELNDRLGALDCWWRVHSRQCQAIKRLFRTSHFMQIRSFALLTIVLQSFDLVRYHHCSRPLRANPLSRHGPRWWHTIHCVVCNYRISCTSSRSCDHGCYHEHGSWCCVEHLRPSAQFPSPLWRSASVLPWHVIPPLSIT